MKTIQGRFIPIFLRLSPILVRFVPIFLYLFPIFDRFIPGVLDNFLNGTLGAWKTRGLIENYEMKTVRVGRLCYKIEIRIFLTQEQVKNRVKDLIAKIQGIEF